MNTSLAADIRLALLLLWRSRLLLTGILLCAVVAAATWLAAQFSPRQPGTVALDVGISLIRIGVPVLALMHIQELIAREVDRRLILTTLTYPRGRWSFLLGRYFAVIGVALALIAAASASVAAVVASLGAESAQGTRVALGKPFIVTSALAWLDISLVAAVGVALAAIATVPQLVLLGGVGFMVIGRSATVVIDLLMREQDLLAGAEYYRESLIWVQWLLPDLSALDVRTIALYGKMELLTTPIWLLCVMPLAYIVILLALAIRQFGKRQFV